MTPEHIYYEDWPLLGLGLKKRLIKTPDGQESEHINRSIARFMSPAFTCTDTDTDTDT